MDIKVEATPLDVEQVKELYEEMSKLVYSDLDKQYKEKKINGSTYADTWAKLMSQVVSGSMQTIAAIQNKETDADRCVKKAQCDLSTAQKEKVEYETTEALPAQKSLTVRQTEGFDDNLRQKLFESQMNAWAMMFSSGLLETMPCFIASDEASNLYGAILEKKMYTFVADSDEDCCTKSGRLYNETTDECLEYTETNCSLIGGVWTDDTCSITSGAS